MSDGSKLEIERKFLLDGVPAIPDGSPVLRLEQGYLAAAPGAVGGRVRRIVEADGRTRYLHTIKSGAGLVRRETERAIDAAEFEALWPRTAGARIRKRRYTVAAGDLTWEIDVFDDLDLVLAEVELPTPETESPPPAWLAGHVVREVTGDPAYGNYSLAQRLGTRDAAPGRDRRPG